MKSVEDEGNIILVCDCSDIHHQLVFRECIDDPDWQCISCEVMLNKNLPWYQRIIVAAKYLFCGKPTRFGYFDEILFSKKHAKFFRKVAERLEQLG